jgi:hypothetical protein
MVIRSVGTVSLSVMYISLASGLGARTPHVQMDGCFPEIAPLADCEMTIPAQRRGPVA